MNIVIEKGIPIPPKGKSGGLTGEMRKMEVGDSVLIEKKHEKSLSMIFSNLRPMKFTRRMTSAAHSRLEDRMNLTREQIAAELAAAGWSDTAVSDLIEIHIEVERQRAEGADLIRVERKS